MNALSTFSEHTVTIYIDYGSIDMEYDIIESAAQEDQLCDELESARADWKVAICKLLTKHNLVGHVAISLSA